MLTFRYSLIKALLPYLIEDKRLLKTVIKKRHNQIDTKLNFRVKKDLKDINAKTESNNGLKTINLYNNTSALSTVSTNSNKTLPVVASRSFTSTPINKVPSLIRSNAKVRKHYNFLNADIMIFNADFFALL